MSARRISDVETFCLFLIAAQAISVSVGIGRSQKIVGGVDVSDAEYPFLVGIDTDDSFCSGSIISRRYVLTAAHCVHKLTKSDIPHVFVRAGNMRSRQGGVAYGVDTIVVHEAYEDSGSFPHDIAIIKTNKSIKFDRYTQPISVSESVPRVSSKVTAVGWGRIAPENRVPPVKPQEMDRTVMSRKSCAKAHRPDPINRTHICVMGSKKLGICAGDSGGPLVFDNLLVGITSFSGPSCAEGIPDVFTSVPYHLEWIDNTIHLLEQK
ncbi:chymotrypsin-2 [Fopius arisanus]|uniref:CHYM2_1 protein n=1 Tax=Fopius arisanus TaxID=64838 RepID=A0A0C9RF86_9HYME|nr:PREDICTED: chymotrypsin-2-like [Fopius arisanus]XP_011299060.1 PREDICTED: chymotrypsin-2-like [Fopius arisanus]